MKTIELKELLMDMSVLEKIGQLVQFSGEFFESQDVTYGPQQKLGISQEIVDLAGSVLNVTGAETTRKIQMNQMAKQPHHIPMLFMSDIIYGYKTIYPNPLGLGATWNPELVAQACEMAAKEAAASGNHVTFAPMVDVIHDARWGRCLESPGEDPILNSSIAQAMVYGFQKNLSTGSGQIACLKHFAAYGGVEAGREYNTVDMSMSNLFQNYLPPYKAAIDAGCKMIMTSLSSLNGIPCTADSWLLKDILREKWGFDGVIISDYAAIRELVSHGVAIDNKEASLKALMAGVDIDMQSSCYSNELESLVTDGILDEEKITEAAWKVLKLKNELGLFENPFYGASKKLEDKNILSQENRKLARNLCEESLVLLKNDNNVLPLDITKKIALLGPYADCQDMLGMWAVHADNSKTVTLKDGIKKYLGSNLNCTKGVDLVDDIKYLQGIWDFTSEEVQDILSASKNNASEMNAALTLVKESDYVVIAVGEQSKESGEAASKTNLHLSDSQIELIDKVHKLNKKIVLIVISGRPLVLEDILEKVDALLYAWFPGTEAGDAIANILFGKVSPSGRLSISFPRNEGQLPIYYSQLPTGRPANSNSARFTSRYIDSQLDPLFPFGYGLSYSEVRYKDVQLSKATYSVDEKLEIQITLVNEGVKSVKEVIQVYFNDPVASLSQPVKRLVAFKKVKVDAQKQYKLIINIPSYKLKFFNNKGDAVFEKGTFNIYVGRNVHDCIKLSCEYI